MSLLLILEVISFILVYIRSEVYFRPLPVEKHLPFYQLWILLFLALIKKYLTLYKLWIVRILL